MSMKLETDLVILSPKEIQELYGFKRDETYSILRRKGCPLILGGKRKHYKVEKKAFEKFLRGESQ